MRFDEGDFTIVAGLPKRVDWDQDRLAATVQRIRFAGDDPAEYVEISFRVPERNYVAWPDPYQALAPARGAWPACADSLAGAPIHLDIEKLGSL